MSLTSPAKIPVWTAAPRSNTSSRLTVTFGSFPVNLFTRSWTTEIRVDPPTRISSSRSLKGNFASLNEFSTDALSLSRRSEHSPLWLFRLSRWDAGELVCLSKRSMPSFLLKLGTSQSTILLSMTSPPRCVSAEADSTSNPPLPTSSTETSNVPPPRSKDQDNSIVLPFQIICPVCSSGFIDNPKNL